MADDDIAPFKANWDDPNAPAYLPYICRALGAAIAINTAMISKDSTEVSNGQAEEIAKAIYDFALNQHKIEEKV